ncbi:hypothetical protein [Streptomyces sp. AC627_RSS907]|uniref:hypothetical protein n=1 Tax=Streptomyces sp. AC627_RSS907 TaxID=2823684 RepID=UPI001C21C547|nr:hypothetical protein [Streptomyces sp. AC627_RSS907]
MYLAQEQFAKGFAGDVNPVTAGAMAVTQRPFDARANSSISEAAAWHDIPSHYLTATKDQIVVPEKQRYFARRAKAPAVEVNFSRRHGQSPGRGHPSDREADHENR